MPDLTRTHDYQVHVSPGHTHLATVNPPSFNWPENEGNPQYRLELENLTNAKEWSWEQVNSPLQLSFELPLGQYRWRLAATSEHGSSQVSEWIDFQISEEHTSYLAPTAKKLFEQCDGHKQWLMYFDADIPIIKEQCSEHYPKLKHTAALSVPLSEISYPNHYKRGQEEGKREAIANARKWIDRDLIVHTLLYRIWGEQAHGQEAVERLLQLAEWSPEGTASLLRPCTWGDEVGCSLARNLFLAYHWLSPLLNENEKDLLVRPMLVRIARQLRERLAQDRFEQYPGHSHTSRLPGFLGIAALALYREHDREECEQWLSYALMIYRGILPFYGGSDGSWVEGPFYASTYSKWFHPFFLSVERLSGFSFYQHPFYQNFHNFARDFIVPEQDIHPFGDGFWCRRDGKEWPGFFSQNPLRIYAARFGDEVDYKQSLALEESITDYRLHLLDVVPTVKQIEFQTTVQNKKPRKKKPVEPNALNNYYSHAGLGKLTQQSMALYYRASAFGNSSHRHADQGNFALFDNNIGILIPTGSYGYRFGSKHHKEWTRQTIAHNLPLIGDEGQKLDDPIAIGQVIQNRTESNYHVVTLDLSASYTQPLKRFYRTLVLVDEYGLIIVDSISLGKETDLHWRLHSQLNAKLSPNHNTVMLTYSCRDLDQYKCGLLNHSDVQPTFTHGYSDEVTMPSSAIESDASESVVHIDWRLPAGCEHHIIAGCIRENMPFPEVQYSSNNSDDKIVIELKSLFKFSVSSRELDDLSQVCI